MPTLEQWSVVTRVWNDMYEPTTRDGPIAIRGMVLGSPKFRDGSIIVTSNIVKVDGRSITTKSGTTYELGGVSLDYLAWVQEHFIGFNPYFPIKS